MAPGKLFPNAPNQAWHAGIHNYVPLRVTALIAVKFLYSIDALYSGREAPGRRILAANKLHLDALYNWSVFAFRRDNSLFYIYLTEKT